MIVKFIKYNEHINEGVFGSYKDKKPNSPNSNIESGKKLAKTVILKVVFDTIKSFVSDKLCQYYDEANAEELKYNRLYNEFGSFNKLEKFCKIPITTNNNTKHVENIVVESETDDTIKIVIPIIPGQGVRGREIMALYNLDDDNITVYCKNKLQEDLAKYTGEHENMILSYKYDIKFYFDITQYKGIYNIHNGNIFDLLIVNTTFDNNIEINSRIEQLKDFIDLLDSNQKLKVKKIKVELAEKNNIYMHLEQLLSLVQYNEIHFILKGCNKNAVCYYINKIPAGKKIVVGAGLYDESNSIYNLIFRTYLSTTLEEVFTDMNKKHKGAKYNAIDELKFIMGNPVDSSTVKISAHTV